MIQIVTHLRCLYRNYPIYSYSSRKHTYIILTLLTPLIYSRTGVYRGIYSFSYFCSKHRLWVLVRTASSRRFSRVPTIYVLSRNMKNIRIFYLKIFIFFSGKIFSIFEKACFRNGIYSLPYLSLSLYKTIWLAKVCNRCSS